MRTLGLGLLGLVVGLIVWALCGIGCSELGLVPRFDPMHVMDDERPAATTLVHVLEWSFPAFAALGAWWMPRFARWAVRPGNSD